MKRYFVFVVLMALPVLSVGQTKDPVSTVIKASLTRRQKGITAAIETMPADKFGYKPTPEQMTFGHLAMHIAESNNEFCALAGDVPEPKVPEMKETDGKDKLLAAVKASFDFCNTALAKADDSKLGQPIKYNGTDQPRAWAFMALASSWADHYSEAAMYLRLNGLLPPSAQPKK